MVAALLIELHMLRPGNLERVALSVQYILDHCDAEGCLGCDGGRTDMACRYPSMFYPQSCLRLPVKLLLLVMQVTELYLCNLAAG